MSYTRSWVKVWVYISCSFGRMEGFQVLFFFPTCCNITTMKCIFWQKKSDVPTSLSTFCCLLLIVLVELPRPGEWSTFIGNSQTMTVPWRCSTMTRSSHIWKNIADKNAETAKSACLFFFIVIRKRCETPKITLLCSCWSRWWCFKHIYFQALGTFFFSIGITVGFRNPVIIFACAYGCFQK